jgi:hypothetical protein
MPLGRSKKTQVGLKMNETRPQLLVYTDDVNKSIGWQQNYHTEKQKLYLYDASKEVGLEVT